MEFRSNVQFKNVSSNMQKPFFKVVHSLNLTYENALARWKLAEHYFSFDPNKLSHADMYFRIA